MLKIKQFLKSRGISQAKAARMCDISESSMSRIVRGVEPPYPKRGKRIADALGWKDDPDKLFEEVEMDNERLVHCHGCGKIIDMYYCSRTFVNGGWLFFCDECEKNGTWARRVKDERKASGAS